jgi:hypothetical protein
MLSLSPSTLKNKVSRTVKFSDLCGFTPKQWEATRAADAHRFVLFGGARGPGKSYWLRWNQVRYQLKMAATGFRGLRTGLFCEDYPSLTDRQISKISTEFPAWLGTIKDTRKDGLGFYFRPQYGGGIIALRNLDDPAKFKSSEFAMISVDELTQNKYASTFNILRGSLRWPGIDDPKFNAASNPDGPGQVWVRELWIEKKFLPEMAPLKNEFVFIPGLANDNPHLPASYWQELSTLPDRLRRAWRDGDWFVSNEGLVYSDFGLGNLCDDEPNPDLPVEVAFDDGYIDPRAILLIQRTPTQIYVFDEIYHSRHLAEQCVGELVEKCAGYGLKLPEIAVGSPEAKEMQKRLRMADIPDRSQARKIIPGIDNVRALICDANGYRTLKVNAKKAPNLVREITEGYVYPEGGTRGKDEVPLDENNHGTDALSYWAWVRARR